MAPGGSADRGDATAVAGGGRPGRLAGKVAIVTGAGSRGAGIGNGKATAIPFAREGARVLCIDREVERAEETAALIRGEGGEALAHAADVTRGADCDAMVKAAVARWGGLDVLHNNVGIESRKDLLDTSTSSPCSSRPGAPSPA